MAIRFDSFTAGPQFGRVYRHVTGQPSWVWMTAMAVGAIIFVLPMLLLAAAAVVCVAIVYCLLSLLHRIGLAISGVDRAGRRNVRVVDPNDRSP